LSLFDVIQYELKHNLSMAVYCLSAIHVTAFMETIISSLPSPIPLILLARIRFSQKKNELLAVDI
jgi:hypothetical protein